MTRSMKPLPAQLGAAFSMQRALQLGVSERRLRGRDLETPFWGVRARAFDSPPADGIVDGGAKELRHRINAYAQRMSPDRFFFGLSALVIWCDLLPMPAPLIEVGVFAPTRAPRAVGVRGRQFVSNLTTIRQRAALRVTSPATTWAHLAAVLEPRDVIAVGALMITRPRGPGGIHVGSALATIEELRAAAAAGPRAGVARARAALDLIRPGARSRAEVHLWFSLVAAGLPEPLFDVPVYDARGLIGIGDLVYPEAKVWVEYQGEYHRLSPAAWMADVRKHERAREAGWTLIQVVRADVYPDPAPAVARTATALARASRTR